MTHPFSQRLLGEILVDKKVVTEADVESALAQNKQRIGQQLLSEQKINSEQLAQALAEQFGLPYVDLSDHTIGKDLFEIIPAGQAYKLHVAPIRKDGETLEVAIDDPLDLEISERLARISGLRINLVIASRDGIGAALKRSQGTSSLLENVSSDFRLVRESNTGEEELLSLESVGNDSSPVVRLVNTLIMAALQKRASDIHIELGRAGLQVKYRIDGVLYPATETMDSTYHSALITRLKVMSELDIAERQQPQDGRFRLRLENRDIDFRVSILPTLHGEDVVIRILDRAALRDDIEKLSLDALGMSDAEVKKFRRAIQEPYGMVLITGPTGSGKTTTLYAAISELNSGEEKIITIEDPVEYQLDGIVQIPVHNKKNLTFARGLRSILRHDPDKIMVGEIRDTETAEIAVQSALTGHLIFTTVHANNTLDVISRFSHMGIDLGSFVSALNCVLAQRLVRKICPECKQEVKIDAHDLEISGITRKLSENQRWYAGKGCDHCSGTGFYGRIAITEFLNLTPGLREMIIARRPPSELDELANSEGRISLRESAINRLLAGDTTLAEINRITFV